MKTKIRILVCMVAALLTVATAWAQWNKQTVDNSGDAGRGCKVINDSAGTPHIFYVTDYYSIMHARWAGSGWDLERLPFGYANESFDATIGPGDKWHLCWDYSGYLHYASNDRGAWRDTNIYNGYGDQCVIALDTFERPHIVRCYSGLLFHHWYEPDTVTPLPTWKVDTIEAGTAIRRPSVVIDSLNRIYVGFYNGGDLKLAYHDGTQWSTSIVDLPGDCGDFCSLKLDQDGRVCISYYDATNGDLKYAVGTYALDKSSPQR